MLTVKLAGRGSDAAARARVLAAWTLLEELAQAHTRRLARTLDDYANADDYSVAPANPAAGCRLERASKSPSALEAEGVHRAGAGVHDHALRLQVEIERLERELPAELLP